VFAYSGLVGGTLQGGLLGRLVKRFGERPLLAAGFVSAIVGYVAFGFAYTVAALIAVTTIASLGGVIRPVVTSLITQAAGRREQGTVLGLTQSLTSIAQIVAPVIAGFLIQHMLLVEWALLAGAVSTIGWLIPAPEPTPVHET